MDPFATGTAFDDRSVASNGSLSAVERRALIAVPLSGKGFPGTIVRRSVAGRDLVFVRGWEAEGTGFHSVGYTVVWQDTHDSLRVVFRALAAEEFRPLDAATVSRAYSLHGCLQLLGDQLTYEHDALPTHGRDAQEPPVPRAGLYSLSKRQQFEWTDSLPDALKHRCIVTPSFE